MHIGLLLELNKTRFLRNSDFTLTLDVVENLYFYDQSLDKQTLGYSLRVMLTLPNTQKSRICIVYKFLILI